MLFKLYVAANADVLDDDLTALDYHYIFNVSPDSQEYSLYQNAQNEVRRQELTAAARASFAKTRAAAASWPKTAVVRLLLNDSLGEYGRCSRCVRVEPDSDFLSGANGSQAGNHAEPCGIAHARGLRWPGPGGLFCKPDAFLAEGNDSDTFSARTKRRRAHCRGTHGADVGGGISPAAA